MEFENKISVITGGAQGIGRELAIKLAKEGSKIAIFDINEKEAENTLNEVKKYTDGKFFYCNVTDVSSIVSAAKDANDHFGKVDILVNSAGLANRTPIGSVTESEWDLINNVNLKGVFFTSQEISTIMKKNGGGKIVNLASIRAHQDDGKHTLYSVTKLGVVAMTHSFAVGLAEYGINVNSVSPGYVRSEMGSTNLSNPDWMDWLKSRVPMKRFIEIDEVVDLIMFLASDKSKAITGQDIVIDGGWLVHE
ncbi:MAG: SDR family oxidoreductase [Eubacteriaceae bacterium]|nr:SDR family oxidoreductase [Eubacteriaceae bacterium]